MAKSTTVLPSSTPAPVQELASATSKVAKHLNKNVKISPRKLRILANEIKRLPPVEAATRLKFTNTKASRILQKAIKTVIADAKNNYQLNPDKLVFDSILVGDGLKIKRLDKSHGSRFARGLIQKRHSRLTITVSENK